MFENETYLSILFQSFLFGAFLSLVYIVWSSIPLLFCFRKINKGKGTAGKSMKRIIGFLYDALFFVLITPICAIFLFCINFGILRWYIVLATLVGGYMYRITLGGIEKKLFERSFETIRYNVSKALWIILKNVSIRFKNKCKNKSENKTEQKKKIVVFEINVKTGLK